MQEGQSHRCAWKTEILLAFISYIKLNQIMCNKHLALDCVGLDFLWNFFF